MRVEQGHMFCFEGKGFGSLGPEYVPKCGINLIDRYFGRYCKTWSIWAFPG